MGIESPRQFLWYGEKKEISIYIYIYIYGNPDICFTWAQQGPVAWGNLSCYPAGQRLGCAPSLCKGRLVWLALLNSH